jgi:hypothetical protein
VYCTRCAETFIELGAQMPIWSAANVQKILLEVPLRWRAVFWCIALTGVRVGEIR